MYDKNQIIESFNKLNEVPKPNARSNADFNGNPGKSTAKTIVTAITNTLLLIDLIFFIPYSPLFPYIYI